MAAHPTTTPLDGLARRVASARPVSRATLHRREQESYRWCRRLQAVLALIPLEDEGWGTVYRLLLRTYEIHNIASRRVEAAYEAAQVARWEAEQLGAALRAERLDCLTHGEIAAD